MKKYLPFSLLFLLLTLTAYAQERNTQLTIQVTSVEGDNLKGQSLRLPRPTTNWDTVLCHLMPTGNAP